MHAVPLHYSARPKPYLLTAHNPIRNAASASAAVVPLPVVRRPPSYTPRRFSFSTQRPARCPVPRPLQSNPGLPAPFAIPSYPSLRCFPRPPAPPPPPPPPPPRHFVAGRLPGAISPLGCGGLLRADAAAALKPADIFFLFFHDTQAARCFLLLPLSLHSLPVPSPPFSPARRAQRAPAAAVPRRRPLASLAMLKFNVTSSLSARGAAHCGAAARCSAAGTPAAVARNPSCSYAMLHNLPSRQAAPRPACAGRTASPQASPPPYLCVPSSTPPQFWLCLLQ